MAIYSSYNNEIGFNLTDAALCPNKLPDLTQHRKSYFLRHIPQENWDTLIQEIETKGRRVSNEELEAFSQGQWKAAVFQEPNWILLAFQAYLENRLDQEEISKLLLYDAGLEETTYSKMRTYQVFGEPQMLSKKSVEILEASTTSYLNREEFRRLLNALSLLPPSRTQFFIVPRNYDPALKTIAHPQSKLKFSLMILQGKEEGQIWQAIAPPLFMHEIHKAKFGANAPTPKALLSYAKIVKLSDSDTRVASIPFRFAPLPSILHQLPATPLTFYHHDIVYHHAVESSNPHRPVWVDLALFAKKKEEHRWMVPFILDREILNYLKEKKPIDMDNFWIGLAYLADVIKLANIKELGNAYPENQRAFIELFIKFYHAHEETLVNRYGFDIESLQSCLHTRKSDPLLFEIHAAFLQELTNHFGH